MNMDPIWITLDPELFLSISENLTAERVLPVNSNADSR